MTAVTVCVVILCVVCACAVCLMLNRRRRKQQGPKHAVLATMPPAIGSVRSEYSLRLGSVFTNVDTLTPIDENLHDDDDDDDIDEDHR